jgi:hypothetical protein
MLTANGLKSSAHSLPTRNKSKKTAHCAVSDC